MRQVKLILSVLLCLACCLSLASCFADRKVKIQIQTDESVAEKFKDCISVREIFYDIRDIDLYYKPNTKGMTSETKIDEENGTADIFWRNENGETVYKFYEGYGEKCFDWFTQSKSRNVIVHYWDNDGARYSVTVESKDYSINLYDLNKRNAYGADSVSVTINQAKKSVLDEFISYQYSEKTWTVSQCRYCAEDGYHEYMTYNDEEEKKIVSSDSVLYSRTDSEPNCQTQMLTDSLLVYAPELVIPQYKLTYCGDMESTKWYLCGDMKNTKWYMTADFVLTFETEEQRKAYAEKYGIEGNETQGNESDFISLRTGKITVPLADDFEDLHGLLNRGEVDDWYYEAVRLNENGEISALFHSGTYSYY